MSLFPGRRLSSLAGFLLFLAAVCSGAPARRIAIRVPEGFSFGSEFERFSGWAAREGIEVDIGPESLAVPPGSAVARLAILPVSEAFRRLAARFPVRVEDARFVFDGRSYDKPDDAIALSDPARPEETLVVGVSKPAVTRMLARRLFGREDDRKNDYRVVSGELAKTGRFARGGSSLAIDRPSDIDQIATRENFFRSLKDEEREGVLWRFRETEREGLLRWEKVLRRFPRGPAGQILVCLFPDPATKARYSGSSRPADLSRDGNRIRVDLDVSAPAEPDAISPVLASSAFAAADRRLLSRPVLLAAAGARASKRWWGRDVAGFAAFARAARVEPTVGEVMRGDPEVSPVLAIGTAASWLEAGVRARGEAAVIRTLAEGGAPLEASLTKWAAEASSRNPTPPARRSLPPRFLRGVSYAMSNSIEASYASPRSRETLTRIAKISADSISIMPFAFMRDSHSPAISFIHSRPGGETDEGTVRAVSDARDLGMSAMVKPQIWIGGGQFVGEVSMGSEESWRHFFDAYRRFIVHHAVVAEGAGAALFCVGTELIATETRARQWRETITAVRLATGAPLVYAANWAVGAPRVPFWDALDVIGVDFYDSLSADVNATDAALEAGVRAAVLPLEKLARSTGKPVVFAEAGYPSVAGAWITPHDEGSGRTYAAEDAGRAVAAVFRALEGKSWWRGVYWWKAFSGGQGARAADRGYNLLGTSAEKAMADGFARMVR